eukprot:3518703-Rhodomonas_salina.1
MAASRQPFSPSSTSHSIRIAFWMNMRRICDRNPRSRQRQKWGHCQHKRTPTCTARRHSPGSRIPQGGAGTRPVGVGQYQTRRRKCVGAQRGWHQPRRRRAHRRASTLGAPAGTSTRSRTSVPGFSSERVRWSTSEGVLEQRGGGTPGR